MQANELGLSHNRPLRIAGPVMLECMAGRVWLTHARLAGDVFLHPGDRYALDWPDSVLVEGLGPARVQLHVPVPLWRRALGRLLPVLSSVHERMRALRFSRRRNSLVG